MEVVILNGITQTAATGLPKTAEGLNALMQRAYNRICLKRGAFCYDACSAAGFICWMQRTSTPRSGRFGMRRRRCCP